MTAVEPPPAVGEDRRSVRRLARRTRLLDAAMDIVARDSIAGVTMQGVADRVGCSVGTVYSHFPSKGALMADLQDAAIRRIVVSLQAVRLRSVERLTGIAAGPRERAAPDLVLFGAFFIAAWDAYPEESHLLFSVLATRDEVVPPEERNRLAGSAWALLALGRETVATAQDAGVIGPGPAVDRVVYGASALLGSLITSHLGHIDPVVFDHQRLTGALWSDLVRGWGMDDATLERARAHVDALVADGPLALDAPA